MALLPGDWEVLVWVEVFVDDDAIDDATVYSWLYELLVPTLVRAGPRSFPSNHWVKAEDTPRWILLNEGPHGLFTDTFIVMCLRLGHIVPWASIGHPDHVPPAEHAPRDSDGELLVFPQSASPPQTYAALEDDGAEDGGGAPLEAAEERAAKTEDPDEAWRARRKEAHKFRASVLRFLQQRKVVALTIIFV